MKFTSQQLLEAMKLEIGDKIKFNQGAKFYEVVKTSKNKIELKYNGNQCIRLDVLVDNDFTVKKQKIWTLDTIKKGDKFYFREFGGDEFCVEMYIYKGFLIEKEIIKHDVTFTKEKYAQEYVEEINKFNEKYKKEKGAE